MLPFITLKDISLTFGGRPLFNNLSLYISEHERVCLVGRNGSGKSTLLKLLMGLIESDKGDRVIQTGGRIAYLPQDPDMSAKQTVEEYVALGLLADQEHDYYRVEMILEEMNLAKDKSIQHLSGGERRKTSLARALIGDPQLLLLDEPTNHLDLPTIEWLEAKLKTLTCGFVTISHDRLFLTNLCKTTLWLDRGQVRRLDQGFEKFDEWAETILDQEEIERHKLDKLIVEETRWSRQGISARRKRNQGRLQRLGDLRAQRSNQIKQVGTIKAFDVEVGDTSSKVVIEAHHLDKTLQDKCLVQNFSIRLMRGNRVGIVGPNGIGKTTLLKLLMGDIEPDKGKIRWGVNLNPVYLDQNHASLDPQATLWETLCDTGADQIMVQGKPKHVMGYLKDFLFEDRQARSPVHTLSGGERNRLRLAKTLAKESNFLILDEPTNDLDMETLDLLQDVLEDYEGTVLVVSHDRHFLDRIATSLLFFEGNGKIVEYAGGYSENLPHFKKMAFPIENKLSSKNGSLSQSTVSKEDLKTADKGRLGYKQQRLLEILPQEIADLEQEKKKIEQDLHDPNLFSVQPEKFKNMTNKLTDIEKKIELKEEQWLDIINLQEKLKDL